MNQEAERSEVSREMQAVRDDFRTLQRDIKDLLSAAKDDGSGRLADLKDRLTERAKSLEHRLESSASGVYENVRECGQHAVEKTREDIASRPLTSVLIAFLVGLIFGKFSGKD